jgi:hypothetical protein
MLVLRGSHNDAYVRDERAYLEGLREFLTRFSAPAAPP